MKTETLIAALSERAAPAPAAGTIFAKALTVGAAVALALILSVLGPRHDALQAMGGWQYWAKLAYPFALALAAYPILERLARPGLQAGKRKAWLALPLLFAAALALWQWLTTPPSGRAHLFFGHSWQICPLLIVMASIPIFAATIWALRKLAPTRPVAAGAAAGLFAGAAGAWLYAFHCNETALVFVGVWYTAGIAVMTAIGAATGRWLLKW